MEKPEIDPVQSSLVGINKEDLTTQPYAGWTGLDTLSDNEGREFYGGEKFKSGPNQMLLTRMLKGIIPVSDVVFIKDRDGNGHFYSYKTPLKDIKINSEQPYSYDEALMDSYILRAIFQDRDHLPYKDDGESENTRHEDGKYVFFDFDKFKYFWDKNMSGVDLDTLQKQISKALSGPRKDFIQKHLHLLKTTFEGEKGLAFLRDIVKSIPTIEEGISVIEQAPGEDKVLSFQRELVKRIGMFLSYLNK